MSNPFFRVFPSAVQLIILPGLIFSSCSIHKRHYRPGYYVPVTKAKHPAASTSETERPVYVKDSTGHEKETGNEMTGKIIQSDSVCKEDETQKGLSSKPPICRSQQKAGHTHGARLPTVNLNTDRIPGDSNTAQAKKPQDQSKNKKEKNKRMKNMKHSKRGLAIIIGTALLLMAIVAAFSAPVISGIFVSGDSALTALNLAAGFSKFSGSIIGWLIILVLDLLVSWGIYAYYKKEKPRGAFTSSALRLLYSIFLGGAIYQLLNVRAGAPALSIYNSLDAFNSIWGWGLIAFGLHLILLGVLFKNEGEKKWVTVTIKTLLILAGIGYLVIYAGMLITPGPLAFKAAIEPIFLIPMILGEVFFALWMLIKGGKEAKEN